jgi:hypothetical protein
MPVGGGSSGPFNGGTITRQLVVGLTGSDDPALEVDGNANTVDLLYMQPWFGAQSSFQYTNSGKLRLGGPDDDNTIVANAAPSGVNHVFVVTAQGGAEAFATLYSGQPVLKIHAAPADGDIVAGECALWFDQTNGAAKLMVKAKQADGTVKTAAIALT